MKFLLIAAAALAVMPGAMVRAGDDCHVRPASWQSKSAAMQAAITQGWKVDKIEAEDGCWEIKGVDAQGRRIKAKLDPATLQVVKLRHKYGAPESKRARSPDGDWPPAAAPGAPAANPLFQNGAPPKVRVN